MTQQEIKIFDNFIRENQLDKRTLMTTEAIRRKVKRAMFANNIAFILADVVNSFMIDCDDALAPFDKAFSQNAKQNFNRMREHIIAAKKWSEKLTKPVYECSRVNEMCRDADFWLALIKLIDDRISDSSQKTTMLIEFLLNMPEGDCTYKVTHDDFKMFSV